MQLHEESEDTCAIKMFIQLRLWQQQASKAVLEVFKDKNIPLNSGAQALMLSAIANPISQLLPPSITYIKRLIKLLIQEAEDQRQELSDELLNLHTALLLLGSSSSDESVQQETSWRYKTFYYSSNPSWQQLQQLQQHHAQHCLTITCHQQQHPEQLGGIASHIPAGQLRQLRQYQQQISELVAAAGQSPLHSLLNSSNKLQCSKQLKNVSIQQANTAALMTATIGQQQKQQQELSEVLARQCGLLSVHMSENLFEGGTGCHMWDAGFLLAEFVLNHPELFAGKRCLEIGCGPGLVASCLCRVGAQELLLTDGDPQTLVNCLSNLGLNGHTHAELLGSWQEAVKPEQLPGPTGVAAASSETQVLACPLDWHEHVPGLCADVIVGSDICYDPDAVPSLVKLLQQLLGVEQLDSAHELAAPNISCCRATRMKCSAYVATTKRQDSTLAKFNRLAAVHGLLVEEVAVDPDSWQDQPTVFQKLSVSEERASRFVLHKVTGSQAGI